MSRTYQHCATSALGATAFTESGGLGGHCEKAMSVGFYVAGAGLHSGTHRPTVFWGRGLFSPVGATRRARLLGLFRLLLSSPSLSSHSDSGDVILSGGMSDRRGDSLNGLSILGGMLLC